MMRTGHERSTRRGAVIAEMAILTPLLLVILVAVIEFGWVFAVRQEIGNMTRDAARFATHRAVSEDYADYIEEVKDRLAEQLARYEIRRKQIAIQVPKGAAQLEDVPDEDRFVHVRVKVPYDKVTLVGAPIFGVGGGIGFTVTSTMRLLK